MFHFRFINAKDKIPIAYHPWNVVWKYSYAFDLEFRDLFLKQGPTNLGHAFLATLRIEEYFLIA